MLELVLDIWFAGFALDELNQWQDAGNLGLYSANPVSIQSFLFGQFTDSTSVSG